MEIKYCRDWNSKTKQMINRLTQEEAQKKFDSRKEFVAVIDNGDEEGIVRTVLTFSEDRIRSIFYNNQNTAFLTYAFRVYPDNSIFLYSAIYVSHRTNKEIYRIQYSFEEDGTIYMRKDDYKEKQTKEREITFDPKKNWDIYPEFGDYSSVSKVER